jgi:hypothetical protein
MLKKIGSSILIMVALLSVLTIEACSQSQAKPGSAASQPAAPVQTATTSKTSFESVNFTNDELGFSIDYPKTWIKKPATGDNILQIASSPDTGADGVLVAIVPAQTDMTAGAKTLIENSAAFKQFGAAVSIDSSKDVKLADGKTPAVEIASSATIMNYNMTLFTLGAAKSGKTVYVTGYTFRGEKNKALLQEIVRTLTFK